MEKRLFLAAASPRAREQRKILTRFVAGWLCLTGFALMAVSRTAASAAAGYQVDRLASQVTLLTARNRSLRAEAAALASAPRLAAVAHQSGLVLPTEVVPIAVPAEGNTQRQAVTGTPSALVPSHRRVSVFLRWGRALARFLSRLP